MQVIQDGFFCLPFKVFVFFLVAPLDVSMHLHLSLHGSM